MTDDPAHDLLVALSAELAEGDVPSRVLPADGEAPAQLIVDLADPGAGREATVHVAFLPGHEDPAVLQYFVPLEHDVPLAAAPTVARLLHLVNTNLPLTGFELGETFSAAVFRHVHAVAIDPLDPAVVAWTISMIYHAVTQYDALIADACAGADLPELTRSFALVQAALFAAPSPGA